ncbi:hypothetical protein ASC90_15065 [Rhizobium sp. Root1220]|nr:DUF982 domain-containing protein [Rhizobium sp. Root1220]KQV65202.1 hypothetical protein ASC90_15065 [Rhizobium sp. Root1220]
MKHPWSAPVSIACARGSRTRAVTCTHDALLVLFDDWPVIDGQPYFSALEVCTAVAEGQKTPYDAQVAFMAAVSAAKLDFELL